MRVIREAMLEAHQNKKKYGGDWFVTSGDNLAVVTESYFKNDDGTSKDKPFKELYNTRDKKYGFLEDKLVEYIRGEIFIVDAENHEVKEEHNEKKEIFLMVMRYFRDNYLDEIPEAMYTYTNVFEDHLFISIKTSSSFSQLFQDFREIEILKDIQFYPAINRTESVFFIDEDTYPENDLMVLTFYVKLEDFNISYLDMHNTLKSSKGIKKFAL